MSQDTGHLGRSWAAGLWCLSPWFDPCHAELAEELLELAEVGPGGGEDAVLHHLGDREAGK